MNFGRLHVMILHGQGVQPIVFTAAVFFSRPRPTFLDPRARGAEADGQARQPIPRRIPAAADKEDGASNCLDP